MGISSIGFSTPSMGLSKSLPAPSRHRRLTRVTCHARDERLPLGPETNDAFVAVNRLLKANQEVYRMRSGDAVYPAGSASAHADRRSASPTRRVEFRASPARRPVRTRLGPMRLACGTSTAARCPRDGRGGFSNSSSSRSKSYTRRGSTQETWPADSMCSFLWTSAIPARDLTEGESGFTAVARTVPPEYRDRLGARERARRQCPH